MQFPSDLRMRPHIPNAVTCYVCGKRCKPRLDLEIAMFQSETPIKAICLPCHKEREDNRRRQVDSTMHQKTSRMARLQAAGFRFFQENPSEKYVVELPTQKDLPNRYKTLSSAITAGIREVDRQKAMRDTGHDIGKTWKNAIETFDSTR